MAAGDIHYNDAGLPIGIEAADGRILARGVVDRKGIRSWEEVALERSLEELKRGLDWWTEFRNAVYGDEEAHE